MYNVYFESGVIITFPKGFGKTARKRVIQLATICEGRYWFRPCDAWLKTQGCGA